MSHTPGPWTAIIDPRYFPSVAIGPVRTGIHAHRGQVIVNICNPDGNMETQHANARLIAAAPDLLAALRLAEGRLALLLRVFPDQSDEFDHPTATGYVLKQVQAAITKATTETPT